MNSAASFSSFMSTKPLTSAPAIKPFFLSERITRPRGKFSDKTVSSVLSSAMTSTESAFTLTSARSRCNQTISSLSRSARQCLLGLLPVISLFLSPFNQHRATLASADAQAGDPALRIHALQDMQQVEHNARTAGAHRMTQTDTTAINIQARRINRAHCRLLSQLFLAIFTVLPCLKTGQHLGGKGLVDFPVIDVTYL